MASSKIHVPQHRKDTTGRNQREGLSAEQLFKQIVHSFGWKWANASRNENYKAHIDCWVQVDDVGKFSVDVKAAKRVARRNRNGDWAKIQDEYHWVEWTGRSGYPGWVRGKATWIAFGTCEDSFIMVDRRRLETAVEAMILSKRHISPRSQWDCMDGVLWKRQGNKDEMTLLASSQLWGIQGTWLLTNPDMS